LVKMMKNTVPIVTGVLPLLFLIAQVCYGFDEDFDGRDWEEPAGVTCTALVSPEDGVYGVAFGEGVWLKHTPILGDFSISLFKNDNVGALLSGIGMTIRIMPRWKLAPFVGGGGSFNYSFSSSAGSQSGIPAETVVSVASHAGKSYWGGHAEAGIRLWLDSKIQLVEAFCRYTWSSDGPAADYLLVGVATGVGW